MLIRALNTNFTLFCYVLIREEMLFSKYCTIVLPYSVFRGKKKETVNTDVITAPVTRALRKPRCSYSQNFIITVRGIHRDSTYS